MTRKGYKPSKQHRLNLRKSKQENPVWNKGLKITPGSIYNDSLKRPEVSKANKGKKRSKQTIRKWRKTILSKGGLHQTEETREKLRQVAILRGVSNFSKRIYVKKLKHYVRSKPEAEVCLCLKVNNILYEYEPRYFRLISNLVKGTSVDIHILGTNIWIEVKGPRKYEIIEGRKINQIDDMSKEKMYRFIRQYPENKLWVITYESMLKYFPVQCYDKIFSLKKLSKLVKTLKGVVKNGSEENV